MVYSAIIGFGGMGNWHYDNITARVPGLTVKGIYDVREERCAKARELGLLVYESVEAVLADKDISLVTIATPNNFHKDLVIRCLQAGKNVISEKPVTLNAAELEEIIAVAQRTNLVFSIHQNRRWDKDYRIVKQVLDAGTIGTPYFIESRVEGSRGVLYGWRGYRQNGGGMLLDWGVHLIDQLMDMIASPVVEVDAHLQRLFSGEVDDNVKVLLRFENGVSAEVVVATNCFIPQPRWHVSCSDGTLVINDWAATGKIVQLNTAEKMEWGEGIVYTEAGPTRTMAPRPVQTTQELPLPEVQTDWADFYKNILGVMAGRQQLIVRPEQALRVMKVIDAAFASQQKGQSITCCI